mmetsp:Transcript_42359/g.85715  ORF Transcript_42359/g.85715 Transcript_42359/m.85715 type:complete len:96 (-) Transcript_42359:134-421(-)
MPISWYVIKTVLALERSPMIVTIVGKGSVGMRRTEPSGSGIATSIFSLGEGVELPHFSLCLFHKILMIFAVINEHAPREQETNRDEGKQNSPIRR